MLLHTYTHTSCKNVKIFKPKTVSQLQDLISSNKSEPYSLVGGRNSFGDIFIPKSEFSIDLTLLKGITYFSEKEKIINVQCGIRSHELSTFLLKRGYYIPSCTGSPFNTIGGDISANVNGKDSWKHGNFYNNILMLKLLCSNGDVIDVPNDNSPIFNAVVGGLGMIGVIIEATLKIEKIKSIQLETFIEKTSSLSETIDVMKNFDTKKNDFIYAWTDLLAKKKMGRSIVNLARFSNEAREEEDFTFIEKKKILGINDSLFWFTIRNSMDVIQKIGLDRLLFKSFNTIRYHSYRNYSFSKSSFFKYQYPVFSELPNWNKRFLKKGMQEIQCLFSFSDFKQAISEINNICYKYSITTEICGIRRHIKDEAFLSFSGKGLSATINYDRNNNNDKKLYRFERDIIETVIKYSGKIYLAKFPWLKKEEVEAIYPKISNLKEVKNNLDPNNKFSTLTSERLL